MEQIPCPDGYLLDPKSPLAAGNHDLNHYFVRVEDAGWKVGLKEVNAIRDKSRKLLIWKALNERMHWLQHNNSTSACVSPLRGLAERIEKWTLSLAEADLIELLGQTAEAAGFLAPYAPMPHLLAYLEEHALTRQLSAAIQDFRDWVWDQGYIVNQVSLQLFRSRLDMLRWRDEWNEIDLKRCWSEQIRADFRQMQGAEREHWRRLFHGIHGDEGVRPAPRWLAQAQARIDEISPRAFCAALMRWFKPLQPGRPQRLSREGSYLLRRLIWLTETLNDADLSAKVSEICEVAFKPKSNAQKVARAAAEAVGIPDPAPPRHPPAPSLEELLSRALATVLSPPTSPISPAVAGRIQISGPTVLIHGELDTYQLHLSDGAIFRNSDGKRVQIRNTAYPRLPVSPPNLYGVAEMLGKILLLAEDSRHAAAITTDP